MDHSGNVPKTPRRRALRSTVSSASRHRSMSPSSPSQQHGIPFLESQWAEIPVHYRPRDYVNQHDQLLATVPSPLDPDFTWRLRPQHSVQASERRRTSASSKRRRFERGLRERIGPGDYGLEQPQADASLLYPQLSPYDAPHSSYSAPDEMQYVRRSASQPSTPNHYQFRDQPNKPPAMHLPNAPTDPAAGHRRMRSASGGRDATFEDEEDYRLFVEATAGLGLSPGLDHAWRPQSQPNLQSSRVQRSRHSDSIATRTASNPEERVSPLEETPTTMRALTELAQMPQGRDPLLPRRLQTSASGLDLWLQPPSAAPSRVAVANPAHVSVPPWGTRDTRLEEAPIHDLISGETAGLIDDELPDYASSQAQAYARQRAEAARRAEELQRRWRETTAQRGLY